MSASRPTDPLRRVLGGAVLLALPLSLLAAGPPWNGIPTFPKPQADYLLNCGGCHGLDGASNAKLVPDLRGQVGFFMRLPEGREYLVRLPNVAFSATSNEELAAVLNFMVFEIGAVGVPSGAAPYSAAEVSALRRRPLSDVSLLQYRSRLVEMLIRRHGAPPGLRTYGSDRP